MRETLTSRILRLDREIRNAITSYGIALTFFTFYGLIRLITLAVFFNWYNLTIFVLMASLAVLSIQAIISVKRMRKELAENPSKFIESKGPSTISLSTLFPFSRNAS